MPDDTERRPSPGSEEAGPRGDLPPEGQPLEREPAPGAVASSRDEEEPEFVPAWAMRTWRRLAAPSLRPDRSASLDAEPRGRLDRLDLWFAVALLIALLATRIYRLDEPAGMHFDEVYHARTGIEFLQDWRYGIPHNIYEYTHPHFAKYAIATGISLFDDYHVSGTNKLGVPVRDAVVEPRLEPLTATPGETSNDPRSNAANRFGDRAYVATGSEVRAYDLETRRQAQAFAIPKASALALVGPASRLYVGTSAGDVYSIDTHQLDLIRLGLASASSPPAPTRVASAGFEIAHLYADSEIILAIGPSGQIAAIDPGISKIVGRGSVPGASGVIPFGNVPQALVAEPAKLTDRAAEASALASAFGADPKLLEAELDAAASSGLEKRLDLPALDAASTSRVNALISSGKLPGISLADQQPRVLVAAADGLVLLDARHVENLGATPTTAQPSDVAISEDGETVYAASGSTLDFFRVNKDSVQEPSALSSDGNLTMPGSIGRLYYDPANNILHALGRTPDGKGWTVYAVESNARAVFADAPLPFEPVAWGADVTARMPNVDRESLLVFSAAGDVASVDVGEFAFSWRIVGVIFGALTVVFLYLLTRVLFRRRSVGLLVGAFALLDGMFFAQSRIAMNDTYVSAWLLAAYLLFALVWLGVWRRRWAFWLAMPLIGACLGMALASKWVALYAIASVGMLILIRSALGRLIAILGLATATGVLGYLALFETPLLNGADYRPIFYMFLIGAAIVAVTGVQIVRRARTTPDRVLLGAGVALATAALVGLALLQSPPAAQNGGPNFSFFLIMLVATAIAAAAAVYRPIAWSREEMVFAIVVAALLGVALLLVAVRPLAGAGTGGSRIPLVAVSLALIAGPTAAFWIAGRLGFGPLAPPLPPGDPLLFADPPSPAPTGWLRLGSGFGLPAVWMAVCLLALPIAIYIASYVPWAMPWQPQTPVAVSEYRGNLPVLICFKTGERECVNGWPQGHTGQTLMDLTQSMYDYHNGLRAGHPASSPWWAWPMDLKPVWFESASYAEDTSSRIYDAGTLPMWWLAIPAMAFLCWQAFRRRSLALTLVAVAFFWQWLSWSRIDRAAFQYHFYTALPFFMIALAYFVAELWHGPSRRTWLLGRVALAATLVGMPVLWLLKLPLCGLSRVDLSLSFAPEVCGGTSTGDLKVTALVGLIALILLVALCALAVIVYRIERASGPNGPEGYGWMVPLTIVVVVAGALLLRVGQIAPAGVLFEVGVPDPLPNLLMLFPLGALAFLALTARDPRRLTLGILAFAVLAAVFLYPNVSALPLPGNIASFYNGLLPTWMYGFQFGVNSQPPTHVSLFGMQSGLLVLGVLAVAGVVGYAAWVRRVVVGYERRRELLADGHVGGEAGSAIQDETPARPELP